MVAEKDILFQKVLPYLRGLGFGTVRLDQPFGVGSRRVISDAVAYDDSDTPIVLIEVKSSVRFSGDRHSIYDASAQQAYRSALVAETPYFLISDGTHFWWFRVNLEKGMAEPIKAAPLMPGPEVLSTHIVFRSTDEVRRMFHLITDLLRSETALREGASQQAVLDLLQAKVCDEVRIGKGQEHRFYVGADEEPKEVARRISDLCHKWADRHVPLLEVPLDALSQAVSLLEPFSLLNTRIDYVKPALDELIIDHMRRDRGQFITPPGIVDLMVKVVSPSPHERVIDPACGTGSFMAAVLDAWQSGGSPTNRETEVHGVDVGTWVVPIARLNVAITGGQPDNVIVADSLDQSALEERGIASGSFDVVLVNPPLGGKLMKDSPLLQGFELARGPGGAPARRALSLDVLFLERCLQLLRPGGRLGIILTDGVLTSPRYRFVRLWLLKNASIKAIIALPAGTFAPTTGIRNNVLLLTKDQGESSDRVFMASLENVGYDQLGRPSKANDLPVVAEEFRRFSETGLEPSSGKCWVVSPTKEFVNRLDVAFYQPKYRDVVRKIREMGLPLLRLEEVADSVFQGASLPRSELSESGTPIVGRLQFVRGRLDFTGARHVRREFAATKMQNKVLKTGDLLVATLGTPGDCALVTARDVPAIAGQSVAVIRLTAKLAEPLFLRLLFGTNWIQSQISMVMHGTTIRRLNLSDLRDILIPLPSLDVQTSIADLLRRASAARDEAQKLEREALTALQNYLEVEDDNAD